MTPNNYYIGAQTLISFTSYSEKELKVSATVSYGNCTCSHASRYMESSAKEENDTVYSTDTAIVNLGKFRATRKVFCIVLFVLQTISVKTYINM